MPDRDGTGPRKRMKISIFGLGRVGTGLLSILVASDLPIETIYIHDKDKKLVKGQAEDLRDMVFLLGKKIKIEEDILKAKDSDLYIITAGKPRKDGKSGFDVEENMLIVSTCLSYCNHDKPIWIVTNPTKKIVNLLNDSFEFKELVSIGDILDIARKVRTGKEPKDISNFILNNKGYSNLGCVGEIILRLKSISIKE